MNVHSINTETLLQFIERTGPVVIDSVRSRFGWDDYKARVELSRLVKTGKVLYSVHAFSEPGFGGRRAEWRINK
jgi:hypothetical protein